MREAGNAGDLLGPGGVLAGERGRELVEAHRAAIEEVAVVELLGQQRVAERQHQRGVGVGPDGEPLDGAASVEILGGRRHVDEAHALLAHGVEAALDVMQGGAAGIDLGVLARHAAEGDEQLAVLGQHVPARVHGHQLFHRRHDVRHQHARRPQAVGILVAHIAADRVQEAMDLALRVMEAAGARPAIGAAEDRAVGMGASSRAPVPRRRGRAPRPTAARRTAPGRAARDGCRARARASSCARPAGARAAASPRRTACAGRSARDRGPSRRGAGAWPGRRRRTRPRRRPSGRR